MTLDKVIVTIIGFIGIAFTFWFFLAKKEEEEVVVSDSVDITVEGGYSPDIISIPQGKKTTINFIRKDQSSCLEEVVISDFKIRKFLPLNQKVSVEVTPLKKGKFNFECGMNMFHGKILVS